MSRIPKIRNMEQFAEASGLSRPTVSKYFNDPSSVRPATRQRIEAALEKFDYRPNIYAINQNRRLTKTIGIVVPYLSDPFFGEIVRNLAAKCVAAGYSPSLFSSNGSAAYEREVFDTLRSMKPSGVLLAPLGRLSDQDAVAAFCKDVPTVLFDSNINDIGMAFVGSDNAQFTTLMVEYLCRSGEAPALLEMKTPPNPNARKRRQGYINAMQSHGLEPEIVQIEGEGWALEDIGYEGGLKMLDAGAFKTNTILCSNDRLAIGFLAACHEKGLKIGLAADADIRVAGQDDHPFSRFTYPQLTTIAQDYNAISGRAVEVLLESVKTDEQALQRPDTFFEGKLIMRKSA
ncbi:LacI family DNA-binding transcriptional regulator [uncultured Cohaesibacter sp.]|uniref:LacI family DNA-binding transcriptional regulator n=1 Tax=uncultured Cohaesibacter sp. TaxID=1002546 RepID=UPI0029C77CBD|nr:LacI family DNA-binding transcriptional regulator [uncultured Cohaesibacter sp.]